MRTFTPPASLIQKIVLLLTATMTVMAAAIISPSLPEIEHIFSSQPNATILTKLILTMPALAIALTAPFVGTIIDTFGRRPVMLSSLVLYALAGSSGLMLDSLPGLLVGRAFLGLAVAGTMTSVSTLVADYFQEPARSRFMGRMSAFMGLGGLLFLMTGGFLADIHWRAPFWLYLASLLILPVAHLVIREPDLEAEARHKTATGDQTGHSIWPATLIIYLTAFSGMSLFYLLPVQLPFFLQQLNGSSATMVGLTLGIGTTVAAMVSFFYPRIRARFSFVAIVAIMFSLTTGGLFIMASAHSMEIVMLSMLVFGLGFGLLMPNANIWMARIAPARIRGRMLGGLTTSSFLGQFLSPFFVAPLIERNGYSGPFGMFAVAAWISLFFAFSFGLLLVIRARRHRLA